MLKYVYFLTGLLCAGPAVCFCQEKPAEIKRELFMQVEQMPEFPGPPGAMNRFLAGQLRYPPEALKNKTQGQVQVRFIVEPDGRISNPEIVRSLSPECDAETLRVIRKMPRWHPGRQNGAFVAVYYTIPVTFSLK